MTERGMLPNSLQILDAFRFLGWNLYITDRETRKKVDVISRGPVKEVEFYNPDYARFYVAFPRVRDPTNALQVQLEIDRIEDEEQMDFPYMYHMGNLDAGNRIPIFCFIFDKEGMGVLHRQGDDLVKSLIVRHGSISEYVTKGHIGPVVKFSSTKN
jgi:hypothetical protein